MHTWQNHENRKKQHTDQTLDATNFVEVGFATGVYPIKLLATQFALLPLAAATASLFLKADTAACNVLVYFHEA